MHKLTIKEVDGLIDYLQRPASTIGRAEGLAVYMQLADTMRENGRLRFAVKPISAWPIVANGRIIGDENEWNDVVIRARKALSYKESDSYGTLHCAKCNK